MPMRAPAFDPSASRGSSRLAVQISEQHEGRPELVKCPELQLRGVELERRCSTPLRILHKKGRRFESPWEPFFVGVYAHTLFYYANLGDWPRGVVPLVGAEVMAVDRIFRHGGNATTGDDCGPCWKVTSSCGRVLLFRSPSHEARMEWIDRLKQSVMKSPETYALRRGSIDGKAALALARRLSRSSSSASTGSAVSFHSTAPSPKNHLRRRRHTEDDADTSERLKEALDLVEKQRDEIEELKKRLDKLEVAEMMADGRAETEAGAIVDEDGEMVEVDVEEFLVMDKEALRDSVISDSLSEDEDTQEEEEEEHVEQVDENPTVTNAEPLADGDTDVSSPTTLKDLELASREHEPRESDGLEADVENLVSGLGTLHIPGQDCCDQIPATSEATTNECASTGSGSVKESPKQSPLRPLESCKQENNSTPASPKQIDLVPVASPSSELSSSSINLYDAAENDFIQQQAAELAELARNLNKDELTDSSSTRESSEDGSLTSSFKGAQSGLGIYDSSGSSGNDFLQQQAMELAEIARNLQSSYRVDRKQPQAEYRTLKSASSSSSLVGEPQSSFADVTDFGLNHINSNDSNDSIFSITQDDLFFDEDDDSDIERLSEFEASDSQFLEASGFLDSIHQVMKDFIVTSQPERSSQSDRLVISDEIIAEIRQGIDAKSPTDDLEEAHRQRAIRSALPAPISSNGPSPRIRNLFSHARSARDFLGGDYDVQADPLTPKDLPSLLVEDTMSIVASILQSAGRDDKMLLLAPFLRVFGSRNRLSHLIRWAIEIEVASVINVATLFRSDDYASRLVSTYSKAIGSKFIRVALSDPIHQIFKLKIADMELNPHKEESLHDEAQADANAENLMRTCQNIIDSIMKNTHYIPSSYFHICSHLNSKVISRFDGSKEGVEAEDASTLTRSVIGGFLFLRFVCPAITTPHLYGLTKQLPPPETRRVLVLVTKLLFKTATGVKFGDREPQFKVLNPFIEKNSPAIQQLFANLAMSPSQDIDECFTSDSRKIYSHVPSSKLIDDLAVIRSVSEKNLSEIEKKLEDGACDPEVVENFKVAVLSGSDPLQKSSLTKKLSANMRFLSGFGKKPRKQSDPCN